MSHFFLVVISFLMGFSFAHVVQSHFLTIENVHFIFLGILLLVLFFLLPLGIHLSVRKKNVRKQ